MSNSINDLPSNDEVLNFVKSNVEELPVCYLLLKPHIASTYHARMAYNSEGKIISNLGVFYKPISSILNESE